MKEFWQGWSECILQHCIAGALMYVVIATVTCQGGTKFSGILTLKRLFDALASALDGKRLFFKVPRQQRNLAGCHICGARKTFSTAPRNTRRQGWNKRRRLSPRTAGRLVRSLPFASSHVFIKSKALMLRLTLRLISKKEKKHTVVHESPFKLSSSQCSCLLSETCRPFPRSLPLSLRTWSRHEPSGLTQGNFKAKWSPCRLLAERPFRETPRPPRSSSAKTSEREMKPSALKFSSTLTANPSFLSLSFSSFLIAQWEKHIIIKINVHRHNSLFTCVELFLLRLKFPQSGGVFFLVWFSTFCCFCSAAFFFFYPVFICVSFVAHCDHLLWLSSIALPGNEEQEESVK